MAKKEYIDTTSRRYECSSLSKAIKLAKALHLILWRFGITGYLWKWPYGTIKWPQKNAYFRLFSIETFLRNDLISLENRQKIRLYHIWYWVGYIYIYIYIYIEKIEFSVFATILDAILDFSARHQLCQFMPTVSETTNITEHVGT